jgi:ketosteroid isomerase-like protein
VPPVRGTVGPLAALLAAASLAGCGGGLSDEEQVRDTLAAFGAATARQDYEAVCDRILAPRLVRSVQDAGVPCEQALRRGFEGVREPRISVGAVRVEGERATAEVSTSAAGQEPSRDTVSLVKTGDGWRIAALQA